MIHPQEDLIQELLQLDARLYGTGEKRGHPDDGSSSSEVGEPSATRRKEQTESLYVATAKRFWDTVQDEHCPITPQLNLLLLPDEARAHVLALCPSEVVLGQYFCNLFRAVVHSMWVENHYELVHLRRIALDETPIHAYYGDARPPSDGDDGGSAAVITDQLKREAQSETKRYATDLAAYAEQWSSAIPASVRAWAHKGVLTDRFFERDAAVWAVILQFYVTPLDPTTCLTVPDLLKQVNYHVRHDVLFDYQFTALRESMCDRLVSTSPMMAEHMLRLVVPLTFDPMSDHPGWWHLDLLNAVDTMIEHDQFTLANLALDVVSPFIDEHLTDMAEFAPNHIKDCYAQFGELMCYACLKSNFELVNRLRRMAKCTWNDLHRLRLGLRRPEALGRYFYGGLTPAPLVPNARPASHEILTERDDDSTGNDDGAPRVIIRRVLLIGGSKDFIEKLVRDLGPGRTVISTFGYDPWMLQPLICDWPGGDLMPFLKDVIGADVQQCHDIARACMVAAALNPRCAIDVMQQLFDLGFGGRNADDGPDNAFDVTLRASMVEDIINSQLKHAISLETNQWVFSALLPPGYDTSLMWSNQLFAHEHWKTVTKLWRFVRGVDDYRFARITPAIARYGTRVDATEWFMSDRFRTLLTAAQWPDFSFQTVIGYTVENRNPGVQGIILPVLFELYPETFPVPATQSDKVDDWAALLILLYESNRHVVLDWAVTAMGAGVVQLDKRVSKLLRADVREWVSDYVRNHSPSQ